jgi:hypothetical protein
MFVKSDTEVFIAEFDTEDFHENPFSAVVECVEKDRR